MPTLTPLVLNQGSDVFKNSLSQVREQIQLLQTSYPQITKNLQVNNNNLSEIKLPVQIQGGTIYLGLNNVKLPTGQYPSYLFINKISNQTNALYQDLLSLPFILPKVNLLAFNYKDIVDKLASNDIIVRNNQVIKLSMLIEAVRFFDIGNDVAQALRGVKSDYVDFATYGSKITNWHDNAINSYRQALDAYKSNSTVTLSNFNAAILPACGFNQSAYLIDSVPASAAIGVNAWLSTGNDLKPTGALEPGWCVDGGQLLTLADFNGDGKADFICHTSSGALIGRNQVMLSNGNGVYSPNNDPTGLVTDSWCRESSVFLLADFNGDNKADFICHSNAGGTWVMLSSGNSVYSPNPNISLTGKVKDNWCNSTDLNAFHLADFNGDGKADFICHSDSGVDIGKTWVLLSNGTSVYSPNDYPDGLVRRDWCDDKATFMLGDFNGDNKADFICHNRVSSDTLVLVSNGNKVYSPNDDPAGLIKSGWCDNKEKFMLGDFNGDGKTDFICLDINYDTMLIMLSNGTNVYSPNNDPVVMDRVCNKNFGLLLADFNGDGKIDITCQNSVEFSVMLSNSSYFQTIIGAPIQFNDTISLANLDGDCTMDILSFQGSMSVANSFDTSYPS